MCCYLDLYIISMFNTTIFYTRFGFFYRIHSYDFPKLGSVK